MSSTWWSRASRPGIDDRRTAHARRSRAGFKYGEIPLTDHLAYDGLHDVFTSQAMGVLTESCNCGTNRITREEQDAFAAASHQKAAAAWKNGLFDDEVIPVPVPQRKGDP